MRNQKVLIIKTGYSEVLERTSNSRKVSLGDVLRTTPLLHLYKECNVLWVSDEKAFPLLERNPLISRLLPYDFTTALQLESEEFDVVINLEKVPGICALADRIRARRNRYGFTFNTQSGEAEAYDKAYNVLSVGADPKLKKENEKTAQELLFEIVDRKWGGEEYILGYHPQSKGEYDVALNTEVGQKWPNKAWPKKHWDKLESLLIKEGYKVTRQDKQDASVLNNLYKYMDWINSVRLIVTNDSLGMHLGIALKKYTIGLFGPTPHKEVHFYGRGEAILPTPIPECLPCFLPECHEKISCLENITPEKVYEVVNKYGK